MGFTFKEGILDIRNTRVIDIVSELYDYGCDVNVYDPHANYEEVKKEYNLKLPANPSEKAPYDAIVMAVKHRQFRELGVDGLKKLTDGSMVLIDVKGMYEAKNIREDGLVSWQLMMRNYI